MENITLKKIIGYSNGVAYILLDYDFSNNTGLIENIGLFAVWCKFDKIILI
jgi:hypothetical protein